MKTLIAVALTISLVLSGCTSATRSKFNSLGTNHYVRLFSSDGKLLGEWHTDGMTHNEENSDGLYFKDAATGSLVRIEGTIIDEQDNGNPYGATPRGDCTPAKPFNPNAKNPFPGDNCKSQAERDDPNNACRFGGTAN